MTGLRVLLFPGNKDMQASSTLVSASAALKNGTYVAAFFLGIEFFGLNPTSVVILVFFVFFDMLAGMLKSISLHGPSSIKSSIFERGLIAKALVICVPLNIALAGKGTGMDFTVLAQGIVSALIFSELYSILGNFYAIRTGQERVEFDAVAYVLNQLRTLLKKFITED